MAAVSHVCSASVEAPVYSCQVSAPCSLGHRGVKRHWAEEFLVQLPASQDGARSAASSSSAGGYPGKRCRVVDGSVDLGLAALQEAAYLRHIAGDTWGARALYEQALQRCPAGQLQVAAEVLAELGGACLVLGDLAAAREHSEAACRIFAALLPEDHPTMQRLVGRLYSIAAQSAAML